MTRIDFYYNAPGKIEAARRIVAKAYQAGQRTLLYTNDARLADELDTSLWTAQPLSFIPHVRCGHALAAKTPVLIGGEPDELASPDVLINLEREPPPFFGRFDRLIEIVTADQSDRQGARSRYRYYQERGYPLNSHDLSKGQT